MVEAGPSPLGLCPVRGVAEVDQDTKIWLAKLGSQPVEIEGEQDVAMVGNGGNRSTNRRRQHEQGELDGTKRSSTSHRCGAPAVGGSPATPLAPVCSRKWGPRTDGH